jgi:hypothetical protein
VDNSPTANRDACRGKRCAFPAARPFAHKLHRPQSFSYKFKNRTYKGISFGAKAGIQKTEALDTGFRRCDGLLRVT